MIRKQNSLLLIRESLRNLDRRSNQLQHSLKSKSNPEQDPTKAKTSEEAAEKKYETTRG